MTAVSECETISSELVKFKLFISLYYRVDDVAICFWFWGDNWGFLPHQKIFVLFGQYLRWIIEDLCIGKVLSIHIHFDELDFKVTVLSSFRTKKCLSLNIMFKLTKSCILNVCVLFECKLLEHFLFALIFPKLCAAGWFSLLWIYIYMCNNLNLS